MTYLNLHVWCDNVRSWRQSSLATYFSSDYSSVPATYLSLDTSAGKKCNSRQWKVTCLDLHVWADSEVVRKQLGICECPTPPFATTWSTSGSFCCSWCWPRWPPPPPAPARRPAPAGTGQSGAVRGDRCPAWTGCRQTPSTSISRPPPCPPSHPPAFPPSPISHLSLWQTQGSLQSCQEPSHR